MKKKEIKKRYSQEMAVVNNVVETLSEILYCENLKFKQVINIGEEDERVKFLNREDALKEIAEWAIDQLAGNVGFIFLNDKGMEV